MHDGDQKQISVTDGVLTILPHGNNQTWVVKSPILASENSCSASIDFNVPGKPGPPPVNLTAVLQQAYGSSSWGTRTVIFYDPTGTIAPATQPLNAWLSF